jgi:hypothetical protein
MGESESADGGGRVFRYPLRYRILSVLGSLFLGACTVLALAPGFGVEGVLRWPVVVYGLSTVLSVCLLWTLLARIETDGEGVTLARPGLKRRMRWSDVRAVEHRPVSASLAIRGPSQVLRVHRQLRGFIEFYNTLKAAVSREALEPPLRLPFTVAASSTLWLVLGCWFVFFGYLGYVALRSGARRAALILFGLAVLYLYAWLRYVAARYEFDRDGVIAVYALRKVSYQAADLRGIELVQQGAEVVLRLKFSGKTVSLSDSRVRIAPERIYESVVGAYPVREG